MYLSFLIYKMGILQALCPRAVRGSNEAMFVKNTLEMAALSGPRGLLPSTHQPSPTYPLPGMECDSWPVVTFGDVDSCGPDPMVPVLRDNVSLLKRFPLLLQGEENFLKLTSAIIVKHIILEETEVCSVPPKQCYSSMTPLPPEHLLLVSPRFHSLSLPSPSQPGVNLHQLLI